MATSLIIYSSSTAESLYSAYIAYKYDTSEGRTITLKDIGGLSTSDVSTWIGTLSSATYDYISIVAPCEATSNSTPAGTINCTQQATLRDKMTTDGAGTLGSEISNADDVGASKIGKTGAGFTASAEVGKHVLITGGTGNGQLSYITANTTTTLTVNGVFYAVPSTDSDFKVITGMNMYLVGKALTTATTLINPISRTWSNYYPTHTIPYAAHCLAGKPEFAHDYGTASGIAAGTISDSGKSWTTDKWAGYTVVIYDATVNGYQAQTIASNTSTQITLTANWTKGTPTGTPTYKIVNNYAEALHDKYIAYYILTYLTSPTSSASLETFKKMTDIRNIDDVPVGRAPIQDMDFVQYEVIPWGAIVIDALRKGVTV